jgi:hypothetical protein
MFRNKKKIRPPDSEFVHADDCRILRADASVRPVWNQIERGLWKRECVCSFEYWHEPVPEDRRQDPYDPRTFRHAGQSEHRDTTDPALVKLILNVKPGTGGAYWWVTCQACAISWQTPYEVAEAV